ncbi:MAG: BspA family leucine-rich repeat surface protein [Lactobacillaceae bacterium]|jgi:surface protein|nr:BspA family leucine-rich repeat surface protein [Lactobacillaceae bacterium]
MKIHKKALRAMLLVSVILGGICCPLANLVIPGIQQIAHAATGDATWDYNSESKTLKVYSGNLPVSFKNDPNVKLAETIYFDAGYSGQDVVAPADCYRMFASCSYLKNIYGLNRFNTSQVTTMEDMFRGSGRLEALDLNSWDVSHVNNMYGMFFGCTGLTTLGINTWNTTLVTTMESMFYDCRSLSSLDLSTWNVAKVDNMYLMFSSCRSLTSLNLANWNTAKVGDMNGMFANTNSLTTLDLSSFNTANVSSMRAMFNGMNNLTNLNISSFNTAQVTTMQGMFNGDSSLTQLDVSHFNTANVLNMAYMFSGMTGLTTLDLSNFASTEDSILTENMLQGMTSMWKLTLGPNYLLGSDENGEAAIPVPVLGTNYNHGMSVNSTLWLKKTGGTDINPTGTEVAAEDINNDHQYGSTDTYIWQGALSTTVEYTVEPSYTITIPTSISIIDNNTAGTGEVSLGANPKLPFKKRFIHVSASSPAWKLTLAEDAIGASYTLKANGGATNLSAGATLDFEANGEIVPTPIEIAAKLTDPTHSFKYAGLYKDIVTFNIQTAAS